MTISNQANNSSSRLASGHGGAAKILVVDDDPQIVTTIKLVLEKMGEYSVQVARSGPDCLRQVRELEPDLILLDIHMPEINGLHVLEHLRTLPESKHTPVLMVSVDAQLDQMAACFEAGANGFLIKPFDTANLYRQVRNVIAQYQISQLEESFL